MKELMINYKLTFKPHPKAKLDLNGQAELTFPMLVAAGILLGAYLALKEPVKQE